MSIPSWLHRVLLYSSLGVCTLLLADTLLAARAPHEEGTAGRTQYCVCRFVGGGILCFPPGCR